MFEMLREPAEELVKSFEEDEVEVLWSDFHVKCYGKNERWLPRCHELYWL